MGKGSNTTSTSNTSTTSADPQAAQLYRDILQRAQGVASTPYQAYTGELTAPINTQQNLGIAGINNAAGYANPYIQQAAGQAAASSAPLTGADYARYMNPYTQNVVDATTQQLMRDFGQQNAQLQGNQIAQGALGGNATGVAKAILAGQQGRQLASTTSGLYQQGFQNAVNAAQQQQQTGISGANALANYGIGGQNAALQGAGAQLTAGGIQQANEQARLNALYGQYQQAQAFPYQQAQWLAGIGTGVGSNLGGTSTSQGTSTGPAPNQTAQWLGTGVAAAGLFLNRGGRVERADGGGIRGYASGSGVTPYVSATDGLSWIPSINIHGGSGAPQAHAATPPNPSGGQSQVDPVKAAQGIMGLGQGFQKIGNAFGSYFNPEAYGTALTGGIGEYGGSAVNPLAGLSAEDYGAGFARGGGIGGYAEGGGPSFDERFAGEPRVMDDPDTPVTEFGESGLDPNVNLGVVNPGAPVRMQGSTFGAEPPEGAPVMAEDDEAAPAPSGIAGRAGAPAGAPVMAFEDSDHYRNLPDATYRPPERSSFGLGLLSPNAKTGLLAAGLGMLASRSPFLGNAVGEGGIAGLNAYGSAEERDRKAALEAAKLSREANQTAYERWMGERKQGETERHNLVTEKHEAEKGFKPTWGVVDEDPLTGRKIYGWIDPNKMTTTRGPQTAGDRGTISASLTGEDYLKELEKANPEMARTVKGVADYRINPASLSQRGGMREKVLERALRYNPDYDQTQFTAKNGARRVFASGPEGRTVRSLNVSIDHLETLEEAAKALNNGNLPLLNQIVNTIREKTGSPVTTNFDSIKQVVSAEIAKAVVGGQTALHDREDMAQRARNSQSPAQLMGIFNEFKKLMAGQMKGLRRQYESQTRLKDFDTMLEPGTIKALKGLEHVPDSTTGGGGKFTPPPGALSQTHNGRIYYYDPVTKQPYPGQ